MLKINLMLTIYTNHKIICAHIQIYINKVVSISLLWKLIEIKLMDEANI